MPKLIRFAQLRKLGSFGVTVVVSSAIGFLIIPVVSLRFGTSVWASLATGQAVGGLLAVVASFGWGVIGPANVAKAPLANRPQLYMDSLTARAWLLVPSALATVAIVAMVVPTATLAAALAGLATITTSLGASWYFVGESAPTRLLVLDTVPRATGSVLGLVAILFGVNVWVLPAFQLVGSVAAFVLSTLCVLRGGRANGRWSLGRNFDILRANRHGIVTSGTAALYASLPLVIVSALAPTSAPAFALADKLTKFAVTALRPATQILQGWVPREDYLVTRHRAIRASQLSVVLGMTAGLAMFIVLPTASYLLSGGLIDVSAGLAAAMAASLTFVVVSQAIGLACLVALGGVRHLAGSTVVGAIVGVPLVVALTLQAGAFGAACGFAAAEGAVALYQLLALRSILKRPVGQLKLITVGQEAPTHGI